MVVSLSKSNANNCWLTHELSVLPFIEDALKLAPLINSFAKSLIVISVAFNLFCIPPISLPVGFLL